MMSLEETARWHSDIEVLIGGGRVPPVWCFLVSLLPDSDSVLVSGWYGIKTMAFRLDQVRNWRRVPAKHRLRIDRKMDAGDTAQQLARDTWWLLRRALSSGDGESAYDLTRQLVYLNLFYDTQSLADVYQGVRDAREIR